MIYELKQSQFYKISHLLESNLINLEIKAVVQGFNPGWVFVDNVQNPKTAMIWSKGIKGFYFVGNENNPDFNNNINNYIDKEITPRAKKLDLEWFEFSGTSQKWDATLDNIFKNREINKSKQFVYKHKDINKFSFDNHKLGDEYIFKKVDKNLLNSNLYNLEFAVSAILEWWDIIEDFIENGVGFCIIHNDTAVCSCVTSFMTDSSMESHIKALEDYRKKGLATKAVGEFLKYCKDNKYEPYWDCMERNFGSRALAKKFNYTKEFDYILYDFKL